MLIRKINQAKWRQTDICGGEDVSADAITNCMKTDQNTLSVWKVDSESAVDEAALAMVAAGDHLDAVDVVPLDPQYLVHSGISCVPEEGGTPVADLRGLHHALTQLSYRKLGTIAYHIVSQFKARKVKRYTRSRLRRILQDAIKQGRLNAADLTDTLRKDLQSG